MKKLPLLMSAFLLVVVACATTPTDSAKGPNAADSLRVGSAVRHRHDGWYVSLRGSGGIGVSRAKYGRQCRRRHPRSEISDWQVWAFSEITPVLILDDRRLNSFWPEFPIAGNWFSRSNYPQLADLEGKLKDLFGNRTSYKEYEDKAVPILKALGQSTNGGA